MEKVLIVIPARYDSSRLPGKPLVKIKGLEMIKWVSDIADFVCRKNESCSYLVATDDERIVSFCESREIPVMMTSTNCKSGTERCYEAVRKQCPPWILQDLIDTWRKEKAEVLTASVLLGWSEYDQLLAMKKETPYSGTTVLVDRLGYALAFSKQTIPAIRKEDQARDLLPKSPVRRHVGLYAYSGRALESYFSLPPSVYERSYIEGLEQMRFLENGIKMRVVDVDYRGRETTSGVDSPEDVKRVEEILEKYGEFDLS